MNQAKARRLWGKSLRKLSQENEYAQNVTENPQEKDEGNAGAANKQLTLDAILSATTITPSNVTPKLGI